MKKIIFNSIIVLFSLTTVMGTDLKTNCYNNTTHNIQIISIKGLLSLKNKTNGQIHDFLILNNYTYDSNRIEKLGGNMFPVEHKYTTYKHQIYDLTVVIQETKTNYSKKRVLFLETEDSYTHKLILDNLYNNGFSGKGDISNIGNIEIASSSPYEIIQKKKKDFVRTEYSERSYSDGRSDVSISIKIYEKYDYYGNTIKKHIYALEIPLVIL